VGHGNAADEAGRKQRPQDEIPLADFADFSDSPRYYDCGRYCLARITRWSFPEHEMPAV
jgi:hypothetical protein